MRSVLKNANYNVTFSRRLVIQVGQKVQGFVLRATEFGVFVDIGATEDGFLPAVLLTDSYKLNLATWKYKCRGK